MLDEAVAALIEWQKKVNQLPLKLGMPTHPLPLPPQVQTKFKRAFAAIDELAKYAESQKTADPRMLRIALWLEETREKVQACIAGDAVETLDGILDSIYIDVGAGVRFNMDVSGGFAEVCRSNRSKKFTGDARVRDKGAAYSPPVLEPFLKGGLVQ